MSKLNIDLLSIVLFIKSFIFFLALALALVL